VDVVDFSQGADDPVARPALELPAPLAGASDDGALLYTLRQTDLLGQETTVVLSALYHDELQLRPVDAVAFPPGRRVVEHRALGRDFRLVWGIWGAWDPAPVTETWSITGGAWRRLGP
jgi:hypothetical protein